MGKREETLELLKGGLDPVAIARQQGVSLRTTLQYLDQMIGAGKLRRSDILFSVERSRRQKPHTREDREIVRRYGSAAHALGDMYEGLRLIETTLHMNVRFALEDEFGTEEEGWWRKGLSLNLRQKLMARREEDDSPCEPYEYTDLIDLREILDKNWPKIALIVVGFSYDKRKLLSELQRLNVIRRKVMHPVRSSLPPTEDEFEFIRNMTRVLVMGEQ